MTAATGQVLMQGQPQDISASPILSREIVIIAMA